MKAKRAAIYLRVSTADQTTDNQARELEAAASARGWSVVQTYADQAVSGAKGAANDRSSMPCCAMPSGAAATW